MFEEDLTQFVKDFGEVAQFVRGNVIVSTAKVIFDTPPEQLALYDRSFYDEKFYAAKVSGAKSVAYGIQTELNQIRVNDICILRNTNFYVSYFEPDGTGFLFVHLSLHQVT